MQITHATITTVGRLPMFLDEGARRAALHLLGQLLPKRIVVFALVDDHVHLVLLGTEEELRLLTRNLAFALAPHAAHRLQVPHLEPVTDDAHLRSVVRYALEQHVHHGMGEHPALTTGSCYAEVVGARSVPGLILRLEAAFPRAETRPDLAPVVGLPSGTIQPVGAAAIRRLGAWRLAAAAGFAAGATGVDRREAPSVAARRVVACLGQEAGFDNRELAFILGIQVGSISRLQDREVDAGLVLATRTRLALEEAVASASRAVAIQVLAEGIARRKAGLGKSRLEARV